MVRAGNDRHGPVTCTVRPKHALDMLCDNQSHGIINIALCSLEFSAYGRTQSTFMGGICTADRWPLIFHTLMLTGHTELIVR